MNWYTINNIDSIDSPSLVLYKQRMIANIAHAIKLSGDVNKLRPHVKTNKIAEVCRLMMDAGINKFKCATIAEAEMLAMINANDVLLAYQPVGPKIQRLIELTLHYPGTHFSCLIDNYDVTVELSKAFFQSGKEISVFIDMNTGMNRTGIVPEGSFDLFKKIKNLPAVKIAGVHSYDGHIRIPDPEKRRIASDEAFAPVEKVAALIEADIGRKITIVAGGSPTFPTHVHRRVDCSPGTFVFWDWGYKHLLPDEPFEYAALVITRVISIVDKKTITLDLGHKAVASESPLPRVYFLNAPGSVPVSHSEEHMVITVPDANVFRPGDVLYGIPLHICPTVNLYDHAVIIEEKQASQAWKVIARDRRINY